MKPTIKTLIAVSILLLTVCLSTGAYAAPTDKNEPGFNGAARERAGPVIAHTEIIAINTLDVVREMQNAASATARHSNNFDDLINPLTATGPTREQMRYRQSFPPATGVILRE